MKFSTEITLIIAATFAGYCRVSADDQALKDILQMASFQKPPSITQDEFKALSDKALKAKSESKRTRAIRAGVAKLEEKLGRNIIFSCIGTSDTGTSDAQNTFNTNVLRSLGYEKHNLLGGIAGSQPEELAIELRKILYNAYDFAASRLGDQLELVSDGKNPEQALLMKEKHWSVPAATRPILHRNSEITASKTVLKHATEQTAPVITHIELDGVQRPDGMTYTEHVAAKVVKLVENLAMKIWIDFVGKAERPRVSHQAHMEFNRGALARLGYTEDDVKQGESDDKQKAALAGLLNKILDDAFEMAKTSTRKELVDPQYVEAAEGKISLDLGKVSIAKSSRVKKPVEKVAEEEKVV